MNNLFLGFAACLASYLIVYFLCQKLGVDKLINRKRSIRISVFLIAILFNIAGTALIDNFITNQYQLLLKSFLTGATLCVIVFILPSNNKKTKS